MLLYTRNTRTLPHGRHVCYCTRTLRTTDRNTRALPTRGHARPHVHRADRRMANFCAHWSLCYNTRARWPHVGTPAHVCTVYGRSGLNLRARRSLYYNRQFCFDAFTDFIMKCNVISSRILPGVVEVMNQECRRSVSLTKGGIEMYSQDCQRGHLLRCGDLFSAHSTVQELEPVVPQPTHQGMYSTATEGILSRPMVACKVIQSCNGCDLGIVDIIKS